VPYDARIDSSSDENRPRLGVRVGFLFRVQSEFFSDQTEFFSNWTLERINNSSRDQFKFTSSLFQEIGSFPNWTQQHGEGIPRLTPGHDWTDTEVATYQAQEGLMLTVTPEDCLVQWPGTYPLNSNVQLVEEAITLPY
jgi:hypothetical protein